MVHDHAIIDTQAACALLIPGIQARVVELDPVAMAVG